LKKVSNLPYIVSLFEVIHDPESNDVHLVMEFLGGGPIAHYDKTMKRFYKKHHMSEEDLKRLMRCATVGLKALHANQVHSA
jgi:serine/threonine protein kinase